MGTLKLDYTISIQGKHKHLMLSLGDFQQFNVDALGLGDVSMRSNPIDTIAAIFDLQGFTTFCGQVDPHLIVPDYLDKLLRWLFSEIAASFTKEYTTEGVVMWGKFPFFAKFTGDGVLFLWDTRGLGPASLGNIVVNLYRVCAAFTREWVPLISKEFDRPPEKLRCGIARGEVVPIGGNRDFVGPCINVASRLQKVSVLSFAFSRKGFNPDECFSDTWLSRFVLKKIDIRGVGNELVFFCRDEYEALPPEEQTSFTDL
jgi:class 3 adenylate cyclase